jgi:hypothetical protein
MGKALKETPGPGIGGVDSHAISGERTGNGSKNHGRKVELRGIHAEGKDANGFDHERSQKKHHSPGKDPPDALCSSENVRTSYDETLVGFEWKALGGQLRADMMECAATKPATYQAERAIHYHRDEQGH